MSGRYGSDLIVDLLVEAGIDHVALNPGASFRGIQDSIVQRDDGPELALCLHEGVAVGVAHGYAKAAGRPMAVLLHDVVGLQHGAMAIYNAWCDRAPVLVLGGSGPMSKAKRRPWIDWIHTASAQAEQIRDYVKWDDEPHDAASVAESFARGLRTATAEPAGPVYLCYDAELQEGPVPPELVPDPLDRFPQPSTPAPGREQINAVCDALAAAERPVLAAGYAGATPEGFERLAELAELVGAPVIDTGVRHPLAASHPLNATGVDGVVEEADYVLALDAEDPRGLIDGRLGERARLDDVSLAHLRLRSWAHDYQALRRADLRLTSSADAAITGLLAALAERGTDDGRAADRRREAISRIAAARTGWRERAEAAGDEEGGVALARLVHELGIALTGREYVLANGTNDRLEHRLWELARPGQYLGWHGGGGLGYGPAAAIGAALADPDAITVDVQADGDLLFVPGALWTMAHLGLRVLVVVHNNRQYGNTVEHAAAIAAERGRDAGRRYAGAGLDSPPVDLAALARSMGVWAEGPIAGGDELPEAFERALAVVESGRPALLDVHTPGF